RHLPVLLPFPTRRSSDLHRRVHDRVGDRVGTEGEATDGDDVEVGDEVEHDPTDRRSGAVVEGQPAHVDVVRRLLPAGEGELPVEDRKSTRLNSSHVKISY